METQEIVVLEFGREVEDVAASVDCCKTGPRVLVAEPEPQG